MQRGLAVTRERRQTGALAHALLSCESATGPSPPGTTLYCNTSSSHSYIDSTGGGGVPLHTGAGQVKSSQVKSIRKEGQEPKRLWKKNGGRFGGKRSTFRRTYQGGPHSTTMNVSGARGTSRELTP